MTWAAPELLAVLLLAPFVAIVVVHAASRRAAALRLIASDEVLATLLPPGVERARTWQGVAAVLFAGLAALALAGPRLGFTWQTRTLEGTTIMVVLDVSRSMDARDAPPSRLELARRELADLTALLRGDAIGLVAFAELAWVRIPPTVDYGTFAWAVGESETSMIRAQGTALAGALDAATQVLSRSPEKGRAILLVSDGEAHDAEGALDAAVARARDAGVVIYALGVGTPEGGPVPDARGGILEDATGAVVVSRLDEARLKRLASETGGAYVRSVPSDADVRALYEQEIRGTLAASERGVRRDKQWHEHYQWPLAAALVALVSGALAGVGGRRAPWAWSRGWRVAGALALLLAMAPTPARADASSEGLAAWRAGRWEDAVSALGQARVQNPNDADVTGALAESLYRSGRYRDAERMYRTLADLDPERASRHLFNAGHAAYAAGKLQVAAEDFDAAAAKDPTWSAAGDNAAAVRKEIAARLREPPPKEPQGEDGESDTQPQEQDDASQGEPSEPSDGAEPQPAEPGQPDPAEPADPSPADPDAAPPPAADEEGEPEVGEPTETPASASEQPPPEGMSPEEAARIVESVPDGTPRLGASGRSGEKGW